MVQRILGLLIIVGIIVLIGLSYVNLNSIESNQDKKMSDIPNQRLGISSPSFGNNDRIPTNYTCDGMSISPPLIFSDVPKTAKSLAIIAEDLDSEQGTYIHWLLWNIDPDITSISENTVPIEAVEGTASSGKVGYSALCPPLEEHRFAFRVYALDSPLELYNQSTYADFERAIEGHILDTAELTGVYRREL